MNDAGPAAQAGAGGPTGLILDAINAGAGNASIARLFAANAPAGDAPAPPAGGQSLDSGVRSAFEPRLGQSFADVRVHTDDDADRFATGAGAAAVTLGDDVFFRAGGYAPDTPKGRVLLAHELAHVVQNGSHAAAGVGMAREVGRRSDPAEREAEDAAVRVNHGESVQVRAAPTAVLARGPLDWLEETASDAWDGVAGAASGAASAVADVASGAWDTTKDVASGVYAGMKANAGLVREGEHWVNRGIDWLEDKEKAGTRWLAGKAEGIPVLEDIAGGASSLVDLQTEITGGALRGATGLVGGLLSVAADPVDAVRGLEAMAEHVPMPLGGPNPLKIAHGLVDVATGSQTWEGFANGLDPAKSTDQDLDFWKKVGSGLLGQYSQQWKEGKYADVVGHAGFDIASLFLGVGEANAAGKLGQAARLGEAADLARAAEAADLARAADAADLARAAEATDLTKAADVADLAKATEGGASGELTGMRTFEHGTAGGFGGPLTPGEIDAAVNFDEMRLGPLVEAPAPTRLRLGQGQAEYWGAEPGTGMTVQEYQFRARRGMPPRDAAGNALPGPLGDANTRMRIHSPDPTAPAGSMSAEEWTINVEQGNIRMTEDGKWFDPRFGESPAGRIDLRPYRRGPDGNWIVEATGAPVTAEGTLTALEQWERDMASSHIPLIEPPTPPAR